MRFFYVSPNSLAISSCRKIHRLLFSSRPSRSRSRSPSPSSSQSHRRGNVSGSKSLFKKLSPLGDPKMSMVPVLDGWVEEGNNVDRQEMRRIINELCYYKRFKHALEISLWMTAKKGLFMSYFDTAVRLKLIYKVYGLEKVEDYFAKIPEDDKHFSVYLALLNCYTMAKSVDKAESVMQKARDLGYATKPIWYNLMMKLQHQLGNNEKLLDLLSEMETKGIHRDPFTFSVCLSACAAASDFRGMEQIVALMESDPVVISDWQTYVVAVKNYIRMGFNDKALTLITKLEGQLTTSTEKVYLVTILFNLYTDIGKKEELYRIWNLFKEVSNVGNKVYMSMMRSLMKFGDVEGAEKIFEEWESSGLIVDFRIPNILIEAYCANGLLEKAELLIAKGISKGGNPLIMTWGIMAGGYLKKNLVSNAAEALKKAISVSHPKTNSMKDVMSTCLGFLENQEFIENEGELAKLVRMEGISPMTLLDQLYGLIQDGKLQSVQQE